LCLVFLLFLFFFSSRRRHTRFSRDWSSDVCSSDLSSSNCFQQARLIPCSSNSIFRLLATPMRRISTPLSSRSCGLCSCICLINRSEERRVGKECGAQWWRYLEEEGVGDMWIE